MDNNANEQSGLQPDQLELTVQIVTAYISNNHVQSGELAVVIANVHATLRTLGQAIPGPEPVAEKLTPTQIRKSITPDALISFIDGKSYKTLKRHLSTHGLDFASYRARYGLPADYPSTAANYSARRSALARSLGLGKYGGQAQRDAEPDTAARPKRRGRPKAASE